MQSEEKLKEDRLSEIVHVLAEELEKITTSKNNQEELIAELLEKFGLIEVDENTGSIKLSNKGKKLIKVSDHQ